MFNEAKDGRVQRVIEEGDPFIRVITGHGMLDKIIRAHAQEVCLGAKISMARAASAFVFSP